MRLPVLLPFVLLAGCEVAKMCTEIGCISTVAITVTADGAPVSTFSGTITVGATTYDVSCADGATAGGSPEVSCGADGLVTVTVAEDDGGGVVSWNLVGSDPADTGGFGFDGSDSTTPEWSSSQPNGEGCPPTCWSASMEIALDVLD